MKEHPIHKGLIVFYLHECKMDEAVACDDNSNQLVKWLSVVMPRVFGIEGLVSSELVKRIACKV